MYVPVSNVAAERFGNVPRYWTVLTCPRCGAPTLVETTAPQEGPRNLGSLLPGGYSADKLNALPEDVERYYQDAIVVLRAGVPDAAAVQLRRTLEAAVAHFEIKEKVLVDSIEKLIEQGLVTKSFGDVINHIRKIGNLGAHATDERVDDETATVALRFTTALLRNLFEVPAELAAIKGNDPSASDPSA